MSEPRPLAEGLDQVLAGLGAPSADTVATVVGEWASIAGDAAAGSEPVSIEGGRLLVRARDPALAEHLRWCERRIVERLDQVVGAGVVDRVEVRVAR